MRFYSFDLDFNPMSFVFKLDLDIVKMYVYTDLGTSKLQQLKSYSQNRQTHRFDRNYYIPAYMDGNNKCDK